MTSRIGKIMKKEKIMKNQDFKNFIKEARENLKTSIDDIFNAIEILKEDVEELKVQNQKSCNCEERL
jgi:hypothetical protein